MTRLDGIYPEYTKIETTAEDWPVNYWDSSLTCGKCETHWPDNKLFQLSPCCGAPSKRTDNVPDMRWPEALFRLQEMRFNTFYEIWNAGYTDDQLTMEAEHIDDAEIKTLLEEQILTHNT